MRRATNRSALSPAVSIILLILVTVVLAGGLYQLVFVTGGPFGEPAENTAQTLGVSSQTTSDGGREFRVLTGDADEIQVIVNGTRERTITDIDAGDTLIIDEDTATSQVTLVAVSGTEERVIYSDGNAPLTNAPPSSAPTPTPNPATDSYDRSWMDSPDHVVDVSSGADGDDTSPWGTIQAAVNAADPGDTILVRGGTYREQVYIDKRLTVGTREDAIVKGWTYTGDCSAPDGSCAFELAGDADVTLDGFEIRRLNYGVYAVGSTGDWRLYNMSSDGLWTAAVDASESKGDWRIDSSNLASNQAKGIKAVDSTGDWTITETTVDGHPSFNLDATGATGDWTVRDSSLDDSGSNGLVATDTTGDWLVENVSMTGSPSHSLDARRSTGNWVVRESVLDDSGSSALTAESAEGNWRVESSSLSNSIHGLDATSASGDWRVTESRLANNGVGIAATHTTGDWRVERSVIEETTSGSGTAIEAMNTGGAWTVTASTLRANKNGINAQGATQTGDATGNYWGGDAPLGPPDGQWYPFDYQGNINISDHLTSAP